MNKRLFRLVSKSCANHARKALQFEQDRRCSKEDATSPEVLRQVLPQGCAVSWSPLAEALGACSINRLTPNIANRK